MRKVLFKKWIPANYHENTRKVITGTNTFESDFTHEGTFHEWGTQVIEGSNENVMYSVAIVETADGLIELVNPENIKFV